MINIETQSTLRKPHHACYYKNKLRLMATISLWYKYRPTENDKKVKNRQFSMYSSPTAMVT